MRVRAQFARRKPPARGWWVLCWMLLLTALVLAVLGWNSRQRTKALVAEAGAARPAVITESTRAALMASKRRPPPYEASARELLALHAVPWPALLAALEGAEVPGVRVTSIDYDGSSASARIELAFVPPASPLALLDQLNAGVPAVGDAWRWRVVEIDQRSSGAAGRAAIRADYSKTGR
jgi:hypothetical protein